MEHPVVLVFGSLTQEDCCMFEASLGLHSSKLALTTQQDFTLKNNNKVGVVAQACNPTTQRVEAGGLL